MQTSDARNRVQRGLVYSRDKLLLTVSRLKLSTLSLHRVRANRQQGRAGICIAFLEENPIEQINAKIPPCFHMRWRLSAKIP